MSSKQLDRMTLPVAIAVLAVGFLAGLAGAVLLVVGGVWACNTLFGTHVPINFTTVSAGFLLLWLARAVISRK